MEGFGYSSDKKIQNVSPENATKPEEIMTEEMEAVSGGAGDSGWKAWDVVDIPRCVRCGAGNVRARVTRMNPKGAWAVETCCQCDKEKEVKL